MRIFKRDGKGRFAKVSGKAKSAAKKKTSSVKSEMKMTYREKQERDHKARSKTLNSKGKKKLAKSEARYGKSYHGRSQITKKQSRNRKLQMAGHLAGFTAAVVIGTAGIVAADPDTRKFAKDKMGRR